MLFKMVSFPLPLPEIWGILLYLLWEPSQAPGGKSCNTEGFPYDQGPPEFLTLRPVYTESSAKYQLQAGFLAWKWLPQDILLLSLCSSQWHLHVLACLSSLGGSGLPGVLSALMDPTRVADIPVRSAFYLLGWSAVKLLPCGKEKQKSQSIDFKIK